MDIADRNTELIGDGNENEARRPLPGLSSGFYYFIHVFWMLFAIASFCAFMAQTTEMIRVMKLFRFTYTSHNNITAGCVNFPLGKDWWDIADQGYGDVTKDR
jgi:hypothetical protein